MSGNQLVVLIFVAGASLTTWQLFRHPLRAAGIGVGALVAGMGTQLYFGSLLQRRIKIFTVAINVFIEYKVTQRRAKWLKDERRKDALWLRLHERNAARVYSAIVRLEGLWVKAGQYLSTRADVLPEPYVRRLRLLQDTLPPRPWAEVLATVEGELGRPVDAAFLRFDRTPLATASIAQVHRATTQEGQDVVVKVQHKGVKARISQDLENLRSIVEWVAWAEPDYNFKPVLDEWASEVPKELDFVKEAANTRRVARNLDYRSKLGGGEPPPPTEVDVLLPPVIQATEKVLVLGYMDGMRLNDLPALEAAGVDLQALVESITKAYAHQIYVDAFFNADPHPGNFLVSRDAPHRPILLDFGLTKELRPTVQLALAKMLLAAAENDYAMLLSSFAEMGLKLRMDIPDDAMAVTSFFFRRAAPASESREETRAHFEERAKRRAQIAEQAHKEEEEGSSLKRNPVDAFPGELVFFIRVLNLLRGLSSILGARVAYLEVMRPYAEAILSRSHVTAPGRALQPGGSGWLHDTPVVSEVDRKLRALLLRLGQQGKVLGIQVCAYKDGQVVADVAAGVLGKYDPRPVRPDSLFSVFSATKGVAAALAHWLADRSKLRYDAPVSSFWPEFGTRGKEACTVADILTHRAGLQNALAPALLANPMVMCDWAAMLKALAAEAPETAPGRQEAYHWLSFGWLVGGVVEGAAGRSFQEVLSEALTKPLGVEGEFFIGVPAGVESRLATLALEKVEADSANAQQIRANIAEGASRVAAATPPGDLHAEVGSAPTPGSGNTSPPRRRGPPPPPEAGPGGGGQVDYAAAAASLPLLFNALFVRRAIIPAANGHFSARALARFYAAMAAGGAVPPPAASSAPPLGSHAAPPPAARVADKKGAAAKGGRRSPRGVRSRWRFLRGKKTEKVEPAVEPSLATEDGLLADSPPDPEAPGRRGVARDGAPPDQRRIFENPRIVDAFVGEGEYAPLCDPEGTFGLGFMRFRAVPPPAAPAGAHPPIQGLSGSALPMTKREEATGGGRQRPAFGHTGMGGSVAFCDPEHQFAIAVTVNQLAVRNEATAAVVGLVCSELRVPVPHIFADGQMTSSANGMQMV